MARANYLLIERSQRRTVGTTVELELNHGIDAAQLIEALRNWCRMVEFPIQVAGISDGLVIERESPDDWQFSIPVEDGDLEAYELRAIPLSDNGLRGYLYHLVARRSSHEDWGPVGWEFQAWLEAHPYLPRPQLPTPLLALHGITYSHGGTGSYGEPCARVDDRTGQVAVGLGRESDRHDRGQLPAQLTRQVERYLREHLDGLNTHYFLQHPDREWAYKQRLLHHFADLAPSFGIQLERTVRIWGGSSWTYVSVADLMAAEVITVVRSHSGIYEELPREPAGNAVALGDVRHFATAVAKRLFDTRGVSAVKRLGDCWALQLKPAEQCARLGKNAWLVDLFPSELCALAVSLEAKEYRPGQVIFGLNASDPFVTWLQRFGEAAALGEYGLRPNEAAALVERFCEFVQYPVLPNQRARLERLINGWRSWPNLPSDLRPPELDMSHERFGFGR